LTLAETDVSKRNDGLHVVWKRAVAAAALVCERSPRSGACVVYVRRL
jgi:hypothetical protein